MSDVSLLRDPGTVDALSERYINKAGPGSPPAASKDPADIIEDAKTLFGPAGRTMRASGQGWSNTRFVSSLAVTATLPYKAGSAAAEPCVSCSRRIPLSISKLLDFVFDFVGAGCGESLQIGGWLGGLSSLKT